ncbi:MAG: hypothetical protein MPW16_10315 [Candidatus Manganitrophus sp.]|nr:MAG: hypothetical protein MPW16_10315 [Candidatus Manganitrophus sp.]
MHKNLSITKIYQALIDRFGTDTFVPSRTSDQLGTNHIVFTSSCDKRIELSVIAEGKGPRGERYSIQVETDYGKPNFDISFIKDDLSIEDLLNIFEKYREIA